MRAIILLLLIGCIFSLFNDAREDISLAIAWWIPMALGAARGGLKAKASQKAGKEHDKFRKAVIKYSPWTDMEDPGAAQVEGTLSGIIGGGAGGAMLGYGLDKLSGGKFLTPMGEGGAAGVAPISEASESFVGPPKELANDNFVGPPKQLAGSQMVPAQKPAMGGVAPARAPQGMPAQPAQWPMRPAPQQGMGALPSQPYQPNAWLNFPGGGR